jgi:hypothetical protein
LVEVAGLEHDHITEQQLLSETLDAQTEQDRRLAQLTDELVLKIAQLEQAEANVAEGKRSAELEQREHADRLRVQTSLMKQKDAKLVRLQAKLDELLLSHAQDARALGPAQSALQRANSCAADTAADKQSQRASSRLGNMKWNLLKCVLS